jgi:hypothetical protein
MRSTPAGVESLSAIGTGPLLWDNRRMKKAILRPSGALDVPFIAYTDESGNTGLNLFDGNQPYFWTGTLLGLTDLDRLPKAIHQSCLDRAGVKELHGNALGLGGIEKIAGKLQQLLFRYKARFIFTQIHKPHVAAMKFVDTIFDSGNNEAMSNFHYGVRINRLYFAQIMSGLLDMTDREEFWKAYELCDSRGLVRILHRLEGRVESQINDPRSRQLLIEAIKWGSQYPEKVMATRSELDSPNVIAVSLLINVLHAWNTEIGLTISKFVHDEQNQFGKALKQDVRC